MAELPFLPLATDAYLADTTHLSTEEHGAYLLLLMAAWRSIECRLPDDDTYLARVCRCTPRVWSRIRPIMAPFWTIADGWWSQKRLSKERGFVEEVRAKRRAAANVRHRKTLDGRVINFSADDAPKPLAGNDTAPAHAGAHALHPHPHSSSLRSEEKESPTVVGPKKEPETPAEPEAAAPAASPPSPTPPAKARKVSTSRGTRLPPDWTPGPDGIAYAVAVGLTEAQAEDQAERMRLWAKNAQGSKGVKLDWSAAWQGWCRRASDEIARRPSNGQARASPKAFNSWVDETREFLEELGNGADESGTYRSLPRPH